jgi:cytochrome c oxidase assembly factor CtaG
VAIVGGGYCGLWTAPDGSLLKEPAGSRHLKDDIAEADTGAVRRIASVVALTGFASVLSPAAASAHAGSAPGSDLLTAWDPAPPVLAAGLLGVALFARAFLELRRRGRRDHAGWTHACPFLLGLLVLTVALVSPLDAVADHYLLSAHMTQHVLIADVAPALLVLGLRGPLTFFLLPAPILRALAARTQLRRMLGFLLRPKTSFAVWAGTLAVWHVPAIYDGALTRTWLHDLEHASFLVAGLLVWSQLLDPARRRALDVRGRVVFAGALFATAHLFIHPVLFSGKAVYGSYASQPDRLFGLSPVADQHLAGLAMTVAQVVTLGIFLLLLLRPGIARRAGGLRSYPFRGIRVDGLPPMKTS